jgi:glycine dehydrogenase subunit 2
MYELQEMLCKIGGVDAVSLQPAAGAHGEFTGLLMARAYHDVNGEERNEVVLPDTSHGTNPASATMMGYRVIQIPSEDGCVDTEALRNAVSEKTAAFMLTNPNTLGIFENQVLEIARIVHDVGAILYYDGANLNAIMGKTTPGKMDFDIVHFNLHKTFSTPHGGGGPGSGPIGVVSSLRDFLPVPVVAFDGKEYSLDYDIPKSVGKVRSFYGNFAVLLRAYVYIKMLGSDGLEEVADRSVLNSNYLKEKLKKHLDLPFKDMRKHEFVLSGSKLKDKGLSTRDLAKRLIDYGFHPPTIYFPQVVEEALMIEPTETESKETLDAFADAIISILAEDRETMANAPHNAAVRRVDEVSAARNPVLSWRMMERD